MSTTTDPIEDAKAEAREAAALADAIADRIRNGDESVTPEELSNAEGLQKFAELKVQAAERKVSKLNKADAVKRATAFVDELDEVVEEDAELVESWRDAVTSLRRLSTVAQRRNELIRDLDQRRQGYDSVLQQHAGTTMEAHFGVLGPRWGGDEGFQIPAKGVDVAGVELSRLLASVAHEALDGHALMAMGSAIGSKDPALEGSTLAHRVVGWPEAVRDVKDA